MNNHRLSLLERLADPKPFIGSLVSTSSTEVAEALSLCGFEWLFIDVEHSALDIAAAPHIIQAVSTGTYPHARAVTVTEPVVGVVKTIKVIITPTNKKYRPDTVSFTRTKARTTHVLCTTCPS